MWLARILMLFIAGVAIGVVICNAFWNNALSSHCEQCEKANSFAKHSGVMLMVGVAACVAAVVLCFV